jgi:hypothetical protein
MKFDIIISNPPFGHSTKTDWFDFISVAFSILKEKGYLCFIHPIAWRTKMSERSKGYKKWKILRNKQILYLKLAQKPFITGAVVDWYVLENIDKYKQTNVDFLDINADVNLTFPLYSYYHSEMCKNIFKKVLTIDNNGLYIRLGFNRIEKTDKIKYPFVDGYKKNEWNIYHSECLHKHQFCPKIIISGFREFRPKYDEGKYGIGNHVHYLLVNNEKEANFFINILNSDLGKFLQKMHTTDFWEQPKQIFSAKCYKGNVIEPFSKIKIDDVELKTDENIYKYFELTLTEIAYIKKQIYDT